MRLQDTTPCTLSLSLGRGTGCSSLSLWRAKAEVEAHRRCASTRYACRSGLLHVSSELGYWIPSRATSLLAEISGS